MASPGDTAPEIFGDEKVSSLGEMAYERLLDMMIRRELAVNTVLQERPLAEFLKISRTPLRHALNRLENEGFLDRTPGRALVVKAFSTRELIETLHVRAVLEMEATRLSIGRIPPAELDASERDIILLLASDTPTAEDDWRIDSRFHGMIAQYSGNAVLAGMIETLRLKTHMFNMFRVPERFEVGHREHLAIIDALRRGDAEAARNGIRGHIDNVKTSIIDKLSEI
ncbi:GntR family transcriptional regulator [Ensifer soli]|uniref:GntR family transcriptional regulator n=1 Tax=Ciceribacter sp. sgz301302 TaxID=3342379 RepID=UPI0035B6E0B6